MPGGRYDSGGADHFIIAELTEEAMSLMVNEIARAMQTFPGIFEYEGAPSGMIFPPTKDHPGSLHYMEFSNLYDQRFHYHPSPRYVVVFGTDDCTLSLGLADPKVDWPEASHIRQLNLERNRIHWLRFPGFIWHRFYRQNNRDGKVIAFSIHGDDSLGNLDFSGSLMEEFTFRRPGQEFPVDSSDGARGRENEKN